MFDLEKSISDWKESFQLSGSFETDKLVEMESHVRESVVDLGTRGLNAEEAFVIATRRLGHAAELRPEFAKNQLFGLSRDRLAWMLCGYIAITVCGMISTALVSGFAAAMAYAGVDATVTGAVAIAVQLVFWVALLMVGSRVFNLQNVFEHFSKSLVAVMLLALVVLPIFAQLANTVQWRFVEPAWMLESSMWLVLSQFGFQLLVYAGCIIFIYRLRQTNLHSVQ